MVNCVVHSRNASDEPILHHLDQQLQSLIPEQKAELAIVAVYTATRPNNASVSLKERCSKLINAVKLLLQLSFQGKLALVKVIAEELSVLKQLSEARR